MEFLCCYKSSSGGSKGDNGGSVTRNGGSGVDSGVDSGSGSGGVCNGDDVIGERRRTAKLSTFATFDPTLLTSHCCYKKNEKLFR